MFFNQEDKCKISSFINISSKKATEMAQATIERINKLREKSRQDAIEDECQRINNGFWHKLFRMKDATVEEAIDNLKNDTWDFNYHGTHFIGANNKRMAKKIINAAKHADEIMISIDDLNLIS